MSESEVKICSRCKSEPSDVNSRKEEFCKSCFIRFISGKQRKHMNNEKFKVKFGENIKIEKVLFPVSFGQSSIVLFDILISLFDEQLLNSRAKLSFELNVLFIDDSTVENYDKDYEEILKLIKDRYEISKYPIKFIKLDINSFFYNKELTNKIRLLKDFKSYKISNNEGTDIKKLFDSCPNRASRHDLKQIILKELIYKYSLTNEITSILFGNNMSTLAEQVISLTVKGRGSEIYNELTDGIKEIYGHDIDIINPLRDVSSREVSFFVEFRNLKEFQLYEANKADLLMNKQKTINEVVSKYFKTVDTEYDNIVSTVVKTGSKLAEPKNFDNESCIICKNKIYNKPMEWLRSITYNGLVGPENEVEEESLREWKQENKELIFTADDQELVNICYGCAVTIGGNKDQSINWPIRDSEEEKKRILDEFILTDEE